MKQHRSIIRFRRSFCRVCVGAAVLFFAGCAGAPKHPAWSTATGAEQHERLMWQAMRDKDWKNFEAHLAPMFVGVTSRGVALDRAGWLAYWKESQLGAYTFGEVTVKPAGADMVVTYPLQLAEPGGTAPVPALQVVSVWQSVKSRWILISTSLTPVVQ